MNTKDRQLLWRLLALLDAIPFPQAASGSQSQSIAGYATYAADMREFLPAFRDAFYAIRDRSLERDFRSSDLSHEAALSALQAWVDDRRAAGWQGWPKPVSQFFPIHEVGDVE